MTQLFDSYDNSYADVVQSSIDFSGLPHSFFMSAKAAVIRDVVTAHFGARLPEALDVGCGVGALHPHVRGQFARLSGTDVSSRCIARARIDNPGIDYRLGGGEALPYDAASFDFALAVCVMHHVPPAGWPTFMREMRRVVRPGGLVGIIEHNPFNPLTRRAVARCEFDRDAVLLRAATVESLMDEAGLREAGTRHFLFLPSAGPLARRLERHVAWLPLGGQYMTRGAVA
jgi:SAM-dependent methyltransferase